MSTQSHAEAHEHGGAAVYLRTLLLLLFLTIVTVGAAYIDFGQGNIVIALFIATIKATLVALFFMHLRWDKPVNAIIAATGFFFLGIFLMFCFMDFDSRVNLQPINYHPVLQTAPDSAPNAPPTAQEKK